MVGVKHLLELQPFAGEARGEALFDLKKELDYARGTYGDSLDSPKRLGRGEFRACRKLLLVDISEVDHGIVYTSTLTARPPKWWLKLETYKWQVVSCSRVGCW